MLGPNAPLRGGDDHGLCRDAEGGRHEGHLRRGGNLTLGHLDTMGLMALMSLESRPVRHGQGEDVRRAEAGGDPRGPEGVLHGRRGGQTQGEKRHQGIDLMIMIIVINLTNIIEHTESLRKNTGEAFQQDKERAYRALKVQTIQKLTLCRSKA